MEMIFTTERTYVRRLQTSDYDSYHDLRGNPNVMNPLPKQALNEEETAKELQLFISLERSEGKRVWCLCEKDTNEMIGCCVILKNEKDQDEIGYQLREKFWGFGYGSEIAQGLINHAFKALNSELITADVSVENSKSIKILEKFLLLEKEFFNTRDNCMDRRYSLKKELWKY